MNRRMTVMVSAVVVLLALIALYAYGALIDRQVAAQEAHRGLERSRQLAELIEENRQRPALAADQERVAGEINALIESAARGVGAGLPTHITPLQATRIGDTAYKEKPTQVEFQRVTLHQVVDLTHKLTSGDGGLHLRSLRLSAPRADDTGNEWNIELVLTYLIYEPLQPSPGAPRT